jgi:transcriptional regulator with XRE-family HTH domain
MITTKERLVEIMNERNLKQIDIVKLCEKYEKEFGVKVTKQSISQYLNGTNLPNQRKLMVLGKALNVSETWLMGLDVPKERDNSFYIKASVNQIAKQLGTDEFTKKEAEQIYDYCKFIISKRGH